MTYAFKPPSVQDVQVHSTAERESTRNREQTSTSRNASWDNIGNDIGLFMRAQVKEAVEAPLELFKFRRVRMNPSINANTIPLENERNIIFRNPSIPQNMNMGDSPLQSYFKRPTAYNDFKFLDYTEMVRLYKTLPTSLRLILLERPVSSFQDGRTWKGTVYSTY